MDCGSFLSCGWFDHNTEPAIDFYLSIFENSKLLSETRSGDAAPVRRDH